MLAMNNPLSDTYLGETMNGNDTRGTAFGGAILLMVTLSIVVLTTAMFFGDVDIDSEQTELPEPEISFEYVESEGNQELFIRHEEGARVNPNQLKLRISGASCTGAGSPDGTYDANEDYGLPESNWLSPGMALIVNDDNPKRMCESGDFKLDGATVSLLWVSPDEELHTIARWED